MRATGLMAALVVVAMILLPTGSVLQSAQACGAAPGPTDSGQYESGRDGGTLLIVGLLMGVGGLIAYDVLVPDSIGGEERSTTDGSMEGSVEPQEDSSGSPGIALSL